MWTPGQNTSKINNKTMKPKQNTHAVSKQFFSLEKPDNYRNKTKEKCNNK